MAPSMGNRFQKLLVYDFHEPQVLGAFADRLIVKP